jgi:hypothetical protein
MLLPAGETQTPCPARDIYKDAHCRRELQGLLPSPQVWTVGTGRNAGRGTRGSRPWYLAGPIAYSVAATGGSVAARTGAPCVVDSLRTA